MMGAPTLSNLLSDTRCSLSSHQGVNNATTCRFVHPCKRCVRVAGRSRPTAVDERSTSEISFARNININSSSGSFRYFITDNPAPMLLNLCSLSPLTLCVQVMCATQPPFVQPTHQSFPRTNPHHSLCVCTICLQCTTSSGCSQRAAPVD